ncbi:MAG: HAD-IA family hydrolase [Thermodesulfobacteriota bacterium]
MKSSSRLVIFDLDGTLVDSVPDITRALNKVLHATEPHRRVTESETKLMVGDGARTTIERAMVLCGFDSSESADAYLDAYLKELADVRLTKLFPGVWESLNELRAEGHLLAICTNKVRSATDCVLSALGITDFFGLIVACDETLKPKPDPGHVRQILDHFAIIPQNAVYVGDSAHDMAAARGAGVVSVALSFGYSAVPARDLGADYVIDDFARLPALVGQVFGKTGGSVRSGD